MNMKHDRRRRPVEAEQRVRIVEAGQQVDLIERGRERSVRFAPTGCTAHQGLVDRRFAGNTSGFIDRMTGFSFGHIPSAVRRWSQPRNSGESMNSSIVTGIFFMRPMALKNSGFSWSISLLGGVLEDARLALVAGRQRRQSSLR
jgi:hypothetical protein